MPTSHNSVNENDKILLIIHTSLSTLVRNFVLNSEQMWFNPHPVEVTLPLRTLCKLNLLYFTVELESYTDK